MIFILIPKKKHILEWFLKDHVTLKTTDKNSNLHHRKKNVFKYIKIEQLF